MGPGTKREYESEYGIRVKWEKKLFRKILVSVLVFFGNSRFPGHTNTHTHTNMNGRGREKRQNAKAFAFSVAPIDFASLPDTALAHNFSSTTHTRHRIHVCLCLAWEPHIWYDGTKAFTILYLFWHKIRNYIQQYEENVHIINSKP